MLWWSYDVIGVFTNWNKITYFKKSMLETKAKRAFTDEKSLNLFDFSLKGTVV